MSTDAKAKGKGEETLEYPADPKGIIDMEVFGQIREMDEVEDEDDGEGDHSFSRGIVFGFFEQAEKTFQDMEKAIAARDLPTLSSLGHFLKGSSAALGIIKVQNGCERIQHYGNQRDEEANTSLTEDEALKRIETLLSGCKRDYEVAKAWMTKLYEDGGDV